MSVRFHRCPGDGLCSAYKGLWARLKTKEPKGPPGLFGALERQLAPLLRLWTAEAPHPEVSPAEAQSWQPLPDCESDASPPEISISDQPGQPRRPGRGPAPTTPPHLPRAQA
jgi:hypothetical protein